MMPSLYDNYFQQGANPWANQANPAYQPYQANPYAQAFNPYQANQAALPYGMSGYQPYMPMNYQQLGGNNYNLGYSGYQPQTQFYGGDQLSDRITPGLPGGEPPSAGNGPIQFPEDYIPGGGQPGGGWFDPPLDMGGGTVGARTGPSYPPPWDYEWPGFPIGFPAGSTVGGENGRYRAPLPGYTPPAEGQPATGIGDPGYQWPWEGSGMWSDMSAERAAINQGWANYALQAAEQQKAGNQWNQQFNENQRIQNANIAMDMDNLIFGQKAQAADFGEGQYQFDVTSDLQQQDRNLAAQVQNFNQEAATGYVTDVRTGRKVATMEMENLLNQQWEARGTMPVRNVDGSYVIDQRTGGPMFNPTFAREQWLTGQTGMVNPGGRGARPTMDAQRYMSDVYGTRGLAPDIDLETGQFTGGLANTLEQNQYIAQNFGKRFNPNTGQTETTIPMNQFITGLEASMGNAPVWDYNTNDWARNPDGSIIIAPTEAKNQRIAEQFGYRTMGGVREKTLEAQYQDIIRAKERASATGNFTDPVTGQTSDTLVKQQQMFEQMMATSGVTGQFAGQETVQEEQRQWQNYFAQLQQAQTQANMGGYYTTAGGVQAPTMELLAQQAAMTGMYGGQQTTAEQQRQYENMLAQASLTGWVGGQPPTSGGAGGGDYTPGGGQPGYGQQTLAGQQQAWQQWFQQQEAAKANALAAAELTGQYGGAQTQQAQQQAWQQGYQTREQMMNALGQYNGQDTLAKQQQDWQQQFQNRGQQSDILGQTGYVYDPYTNQKLQTLAGQQQGWGQTFQQSEADRANALAAGGLTGMYNGQQTLAGQQAGRDWQAQQANIMGYWPGATTGQSGGGTGGDYTPGGGQPGGGEYPGGGNFPGQPAPQNPWAAGQPTMAMQAQQWQQNTMFPAQQATERRGQNYAAYGRATPRNNRWA